LERPDDAKRLVAELGDEHPHYRGARQVEVAQTVGGELLIEPCLRLGRRERAPVDGLERNLDRRDHLLAELGDTLPAEPRPQDRVTARDGFATPA
jgi:hypothetical protein